jgi:hypothetical protein
MGTGFLSDSEREAWNSLGESFRYSDVKRALVTLSRFFTTAEK